MRPFLSDLFFSISGLLVGIFIGMSLEAAIQLHDMEKVITAARHCEAALIHSKYALENEKAMLDEYEKVLLRRERIGDGP